MKNEALDTNSTLGRLVDLKEKEEDTNEEKKKSMPSRGRNNAKVFKAQ